jgi:hypothetical protein
MAIQKGPNKMIGFIDGKTYYKMGNQYYVKNSSGPSRQTIRKDPAFKTVRENNHEFGACSSIGSSFRKSFGPMLVHFSDKLLNRNVTSLFSRIIHQGVGDHGCRSIEILANSAIFQNFQFKKIYSFDQVFKAVYSLKVSADRREVSLSVSSGPNEYAIYDRTSATHFKLILCVVCFSNHGFDIHSEKYLPVDPVINKLCMISNSSLFSIKDTIDGLVLQVKLDTVFEPSLSMALIACPAIELYQEVAGTMYRLEQSCMMVGGVF